MIFMFQRNLDLNEALLRAFKFACHILLKNLVDWVGGGVEMLSFWESKSCGFNEMLWRPWCINVNILQPIILILNNSPFLYTSVSWWQRYTCIQDQSLSSDILYLRSIFLTRYVTSRSVKKKKADIPTMATERKDRHFGQSTVPSVAEVTDATKNYAIVSQD